MGLCDWLFGDTKRSSEPVTEANCPWDRTPSIYQNTRAEPRTPRSQVFRPPVKCPPTKYALQANQSFVGLRVPAANAALFSRMNCT